MIKLNVEACCPENPPEDVLKFNHGRRFPLAVVAKDLNNDVDDSVNTTCSILDEIEGLLAQFNCYRVSKDLAADEKEADAIFSKLLNVRKQNTLISIDPINHKEGNISSDMRLSLIMFQLGFLLSTFVSSVKSMAARHVFN